MFCLSGRAGGANPHTTGKKNFSALQRLALMKPEPDSGSATPSAEVLLEALSRRYREPLRRYFLMRLRHEAEAEDLTQETFARIGRRADLDGVSDLDSFVFTVAVNLLRDRSRRRATSAGFLAEFSAVRAEKFEALSPERVLNARQALRSALQTLEQVDARTRDVFLLHRVDGVKQAEIARRYGISVSSVEKYIVKCLKLLAEARNAPDGSQS